MREFKHIADLIKQSRRSSQLTQKELAEKLDLSEQQISNVERTYCSIPKNKINLACRTLGIKQGNMYRALWLDAMESFLSDFKENWDKNKV